MTTITNSATLIDANGYIQNQGIEVADHGETISIGGTEHLKSDLVIEPGRITGAAGWCVAWDEFEIAIHTNDGERFASVRHIASDCGADFYQSGEEIDWQDNNGLLANCSREVVSAARKAAKDAL